MKNYQYRLLLKEPGHIYLYLSNDNVSLGGAQVEVYFDDFKVEHVKSPVIQSQDYYPFGFAFGSYQRENALINQYQYNGKEFQDELSLGWIDYGARMYQSDIGRWGQVDPYTDYYEAWSAYCYVKNNPISRNDPDGRWVKFFVGAIVRAATDYAAQVIVNIAEGKDLGDALTDVDGASIATSAALGVLTSGASAVTRTIGATAAHEVAKTTTEKVWSRA